MWNGSCYDCVTQSVFVKVNSINALVNCYPATKRTGINILLVNNVKILTRNLIYFKAFDV